MMYNLTDNGSGPVLTVFDPETATPRIITSVHPNFATITAKVTHGASWSDIEPLLDVSAGLNARLSSLSDRVTFDGKNLRWDGDIINNAMSRHVIRLLRQQDESFISVVRFMERLAANPSQVSRIHLWSWLNAHDFTLTPDGMIVGYKGVKDTPDNLSVHAGNEDVSVNGVIHRGHIPNLVGARISMSRYLVESDRGVTCSVGLHVGTYDYARNFGSKVLHVLVDPAHVVSVPRDAQAQKMRVHSYQVLSVDPSQITTPVYYSNGDDQCDDCERIVDDCECNDDWCDDCDRIVDDCICGRVDRHSCEVCGAHVKDCTGHDTAHDVTFVSDDN